MATEAQKQYYREWRRKNRSHVREYENARRDKTNSRKRARRKLEKVYGKSALRGKSVHHKDNNPQHNGKKNLGIKKNFHGYSGRGYKKRK